MNIKKYLFVLLVFLLAITFVNAQEEVVVSQEVTLDEKITSEDLNISEPRILPDSPLYFLKELSRGLGNLLTFSPVSKAERQLRHANEKLIEARILSKEEGNEEIVTKAMENYQKVVEKVGDRLERIKEREESNPKYQVLVDKFTEDVFKQHRIISVLNSKLEDAPEDLKNRIKKVREEVVSKMGEVLNKVDGENIDVRVNKVIERISGSNFKQLKNLEVLEELEEKLPENALPAIRRAQDNALKRFEEDLEELPEDVRKEKLEAYMEGIKGNEARHLEILENLRKREDVSKDLVDIIDSAKEKSLLRIKNKIEKLETNIAWERYLEHLQDGSIEKLEVLKQIENNLDEEGVKKIELLKEKAIEKFKIIIQSPKNREEILKKLNASVGQFEVIEELEERLSEDKNEFIKELREKTFSNLKEGLEKNVDSAKRELYLKKISGDDPNQIQVLRTVQEKLNERLPESANAVQVLESVILRQTERVRDRISNISDTSSLENFKNRIEKSTTEVKKEILNRIPDLIQKIETRKDDINVGLANPAAVYCLKQGGKLVNTVTNSSVGANCVFPNGIKCNQWEFYRGECVATKSSKTVPPTPASSLIKYIKPITDIVKTNSVEY